MSQARTPPSEIASKPAASAFPFRSSAARWSKMPQSGPIVW